MNISFLKEGQNNYYLRIENIVNTIIEVELPQLRKLDMGNFTIDHQYTIEVGGRSKDGKQIAGVVNSFIASADEEYVLGNKIPLWLFGLMY